jgi:hypothetical protein
MVLDSFTMDTKASRRLIAVRLKGGLSAVSRLLVVSSMLLLLLLLLLSPVRRPRR